MSGQGSLPQQPRTITSSSRVILSFVSVGWPGDSYAAMAGYAPGYVPRSNGSRRRASSFSAGLGHEFYRRLPDSWLRSAFSRKGRFTEKRREGPPFWGI